ncbi:MAG: type IV secretion system DNA-binding domain-containing protein [Candidatus Moranbacteria bacterium]|nr:type IV secretion system DNA-binding domain-containing protein [Candidatus Moranbacteria bacterium]
MEIVDLNVILVPLLWLFSFFVFISGAILVLRSFLNFRSQINRSMNMDLEVIRVTKIFKEKNETQARDGQAWKEEIGAMEQLLGALANIKEKKTILGHLLYSEPYIALEIANPSNSEEIFFYLAVPRKFRESIEKQVHSYFPHASVEKVPEYTIFMPGSFTAAAALTLKKSYALPVTTYENMEVDPLNEISNALSKLETLDEGAVIQMILRPAGKNWRRLGKGIAHKMQQGKQLKDAHETSLVMELGKGAVQVIRNKPENQMFKPEPVQLTPEEQELLKRIETKSNKVGFKVNIRLLASARTQQRADEILAHIENAFAQFENHEVNHFIIKKRLKGKKISYDYIFRNFDEENSIILSTEEISSIFHFPISTTETPKIKWLKSGAAPPPLNIPENGVLLGYNDYRGLKTEIRLADNDRRRHLYTVGQTGTGKSNFLQEMAKQDAKNGKGFCFIDPHGDAIEDILTSIPKERAEDVIIFDPSDMERPFGLNMLEYDPAHPEQKTFVINEMIGIFDQLYDLKATGGPMFEQYVRNAMLLIMEDPESGSTLMEISKVLADEDFRRMKLTKCKNPVVTDFWIKEAEKAGGDAALANMVPYITSKLTTFVSNDMMRPIIAQQKSTLNFREIMDEGKILLVKLSKGKIGEINAHLLGMVVVGKILMNALARGDMPEDQRRDFYLYLDEFQNVTTNSISQILSEARKYRLCLVIAHQFIGQLSEEISKAVFGNVGSMVSLRVGPEDAEFLEKQFAPVFTANDLVNVDNYKGFGRVLLNGELSKPFNLNFYPPTSGNQEIANYLKELSRLKYGRDADIVNREIMERAKFARQASQASF